MNPIALSLGSNIQPKENLLRACKELKNTINDFKQSSFYITKPWGYLPQDNFLNIAMTGTTDLTPLELLNECQRIEKLLLRKRRILNGPRTIDIDILLYDQKIVQTEKLTLPHPGLLLRDFMLIPLLEINHSLIHPLSKNPIKDHQNSIQYHQILSIKK